jgi:Na+/H+ antiporter NhaC
MVAVVAVVSVCCAVIIQLLAAAVAAVNVHQQSVSVRCCGHIAADYYSSGTK